MVKIYLQNYRKIIKKSMHYVDIKNSCKKNKTDSLGDKDGKFVRSFIVLRSFEEDIKETGENV